MLVRKGFGPLYWTHRLFAPCVRLTSQGGSLNALVGLDQSATDEELVARCLAGETECFNQLIVRWERPIYALALRLLGNNEDARDVTQDTFLRAFRALSGFKGQAKFSSWLYRIALNLCRDWIRRQRRTPIVPAPDGVELAELGSSERVDEPMEDVLARRQLSQSVAKAMRELTADQRAALILKEYHGLTFQEIAELLGCPLSTVKTRLYQGLTVLRRELARTGVTSDAQTRTVSAP
jgi:RNA polymerase sigma-70 factor, ECF subfamily